MKKVPLALKAVAHHEAGHAIVAREEGVSLREISIIPDGGLAGYVRHGLIRRDLALSGNSQRDRIQAEKYVRVCLAGNIAQRKFNPRTVRRHHGAEDLAKASSALLSIATPGKHADTYMKLLHIEAGQIIEAHWHLIEALAAELIVCRKMSGRKATRFIEEWRQSNPDWKPAWPGG